MTNPSVICFLGALLIAVASGSLCAYRRRNRIRDWFVGWSCYMMCKDMYNRGIPFEPATNWIHKTALEYAIKYNKKAVFMTLE